MNSIASLRSGRCSKLRGKSVLYSYIGCMDGIDQLAPGYYSLAAKLKVKTYQCIILWMDSVIDG